VPEGNGEAIAVDLDRKARIGSAVLLQDLGMMPVCGIEFIRQVNQAQHKIPRKKPPVHCTGGLSSVELSFDYAVRALRTNHPLSFLFPVAVALYDSIIAGIPCTPIICILI